MAKLLNHGGKAIILPVNKPRCVLIVGATGKIEMPNVAVESPVPEGRLTRLASSAINMASAGYYKLAPRLQKIAFLEVAQAAFMSAYLLNATNLMNEEEYHDLIDLIQRLVASDLPRLYFRDGTLLRVRIKIEDPEFGVLQCPIFATFSNSADAIVFYSHGTGYQFLEWARRYHPDNPKLIAACDVLGGESILLIAKVTTFNARPDLITKFKLL